MASELRIVVDTGVAISAVILPRSVPRQAFDRAFEVGTLLISKATTAELDEVFRRPKFDRYVTPEQRREFLAALVRDAEVVDTNETIALCRDPKDDKFLELAVCGTASHIISGDRDLQALHPFRGIAIVTPQSFLDEVASG